MLYTREAASVYEMSLLHLRPTLRNVKVTLAPNDASTNTSSVSHLDVFWSFIIPIGSPAS